jgi:hypothetical protein
VPPDSAIQGFGSLGWVFAGVATLLALVQTARVFLLRASRSRASRARIERAADGEARAEGLLRSAGYDVLARQVRGAWTIWADGAPVAVGLRADLLVAREGRRYVAEVKTGSLAPRLDHGPTRRQLLEYRVAFDVDGVLLVDAERGRVIAVEMELAQDAESVGPAWLAATGWTPWLLVFAAGAGAGGALALALGR